jgi:hypothetical protein
MFYASHLRVFSFLPIPFFEEKKIYVKNVPRIFFMPFLLPFWPKLIVFFLLELRPR